MAPSYLGTDSAGNEVNLDELRGKVVVVSFWVSWCKSCKNELAILNNLQQQVGTDLLKVVAVALSKENKLSFKKYREQLAELDLTLTHDKFGKIAKKYGVDKAPHLFVISKEGRITLEQSDYKKTPVNALVANLKQELVK
ncbi:TlpA family protein disulfide reductase [Thalassotalea agarivorans]|uniref:TlpA family protein disulfide reductase n=1 Tax=Thalassotalea agarivorans TaxID=349064 RepID=UPI002481C649|nr:TlpA disulfide reductase family protein [Thalassotalea agarivorans]